MRRYLLLLGYSLAASCNTDVSKDTVSHKQDSIKSPLTVPLYAKIQKLLTHFKDNTAFPVVIDSGYMANITAHDSLGTNEVKMLANFHHGDMLTNDSNEVCDFYIIDSLKAKHILKKSIKNFRELMPRHANAFALEKIQLPDRTTLLLWGLKEASTIDTITNIYFTAFMNNSIHETFIMGRLISGVYPVGTYRTILSGTLYGDGKLIMEDNQYNSTLDNPKEELNHTHYEYSLKQDNVTLKIKKTDKAKNR
jgi:hypothetical protein